MLNCLKTVLCVGLRQDHLLALHYYGFLPWLEATKLNVWTELRLTVPYFSGWMKKLIVRHRELLRMNNLIIAHRSS